MLPKDRLTLRLSYAYLSSLAIGMYLRNMLYNRSGRWCSSCSCPRARAAA